MSPAVQWQAVSGVTHAWIAQCEGYVSLCGREVRGFHGQQSGIRCGQCVTSSGWAEQTGQPSYLTPQRYQRFDRPSHRGPPIPWPAPMIIPEETPDAQRPEETQVMETEGRQEETALGSKLTAPTSIAGYRALPDAEQRYWAPVMLAQAGQEAVWHRGEETAEQFQQRCYKQLREGHDEPTD